MISLHCYRFHRPFFLLVVVIEIYFYFLHLFVGLLLMSSTDANLSLSRLFPIFFTPLFFPAVISRGLRLLIPSCPHPSWLSLSIFFDPPSFCERVCLCVCARARFVVAAVDEAALLLLWQPSAARWLGYVFSFLLAVLSRSILCVCLSLLFCCCRPNVDVVRALLLCIRNSWRWLERTVSNQPETCISTVYRRRHGCACRKWTNEKLSLYNCCMRVKKRQLMEHDYSPSSV